MYCAVKLALQNLLRHQDGFNCLYIPGYSNICVKVSTSEIGELFFSDYIIIQDRSLGTKMNLDSVQNAELKEAFDEFDKVFEFEYLLGGANKTTSKH